MSDKHKVNLGSQSYQSQRIKRLTAENIGLRAEVDCLKKCGARAMWELNHFDGCGREAAGRAYDILADEFEEHRP